MGEEEKENLSRSLSAKIKIKPVAGWDVEGEVAIPRNRKSLDSGTVAPSLTSWLILSRLPPNPPISYQQTAVSMLTWVASYMRLVVICPYCWTLHSRQLLGDTGELGLRT